MKEIKFLSNIKDLDIPVNSMVSISADLQAENIKESIPSGFTTLSELDYEYMLNSENQVKLKSESVAYLAGYKVVIPKDTIINIGKAPEKEPREDLLFLEAWKDDSFKLTGKLKYRIRCVENIDFNKVWDQANQGADKYIGLNQDGSLYPNIIPQGGLPSPPNKDIGWPNIFQNRCNLPSIDNSGTIIKTSMDSGLWSNLSFTSNIEENKAKFKTLDGFVYAVPMFRLYRKPSCGKAIPFEYEKINPKVDYSKFMNLMKEEKVERVINEDINGNSLVNMAVDSGRTTELNTDINLYGSYVNCTDSAIDSKIDISAEGNSLFNLATVKNVNQLCMAGFGYGVSMSITKPGYYRWEKSTANNEEFYPKIELYSNRKLIIPGKTYTIQYTIRASQEIDLGMSINNGDAYYLCGDPKTQLTGITDQGRGKYKIVKKVFTALNPTEPGLPTNIGFGCMAKNQADTTYPQWAEISNLVILEGDWTNKIIPPYFEGLKSVAELENNQLDLTLSNKNICHVNNVEIPNFDATSFGYTLGSAWAYNIPCKPNTTYHLKFTKHGTVNYGVCVFIDRLKQNFISTSSHGQVYDTVDQKTGLELIGGYGATSNTSFTTPSWARYIHLTSGNSVENPTTSFTYKLTDIILSEVNENFWTNRKNNKLLSLSAPLRSISNTVKDTIEKIEGKWFIKRMCGEVIIDKNLFGIKSGDIWLTKTDVTTFEQYHPINMLKNELITFVNDKLPNNVFDDQISSLTGKEGIATHQSGGVILSIAKSKLTSQDLAGLDIWLRANPIKLIYQLANPTYEEITSIIPELITYGGFNNIYNESLIPCNLKVRNSSYGLKLLSPNTTYNVKVNSPNEVDIEYNGVKSRTVNKKALIATGSTITDTNLYISGRNQTISNIVVSKGESDKYFTGLKSLGEDENNLITVTNSILNESSYDPCTGNQKLTTLNGISHIQSDNLINPIIEAEVKRGSTKISDLTNFGKINTVGDEIVEFNKIKGKTYQNLIQDKRNSEITLNPEINTKSISMTTINNTVTDGKVDINIEGRTIQNIIKRISHKSDEWIDNTGKYTLNLPDTTFQPFILFELLYALKANTEYTIFSEIIDYSSGFPHFCFMSEDNSIVASTTEAAANSNGIKAFKFTTKDISSNVIAKMVRIIPRYGVSNIYSISKKIAVLEGDYTNTPLSEIPYIEGIKSVGEQENNKITVRTCGKNLFNHNNLNIPNFNSNPNIIVEKVMNGFKIKNTSSFISYWTIGASIEISVKPNTTYSLGINKTVIKDAYAGRTTEWGAGYTWIYSKYSDSNQKLREFKLKDNDRTISTFTSGNSNKLIIEFTTLSDIITSNGEYDITNIQLEELKEGASATAYELYQEYKQEIQLTEPLRKIPSGVCDEIVGNKLIRRITKLLINDINMVTLCSPISNDKVLGAKIELPYHIKIKEPTNGGDFYSDKFLGITFPLTSINYDTGLRITNAIYYRLEKKDLVSFDLNGLKAWLQNNPITVYCELATPTIENITYNENFNTFNGVTNVISDNYILPRLNIRNQGYAALLKTNTSYTVKSSNTNLNISINGIKGLNNTLITTPSTALIDNKIRFYGTGKVNNIMLLEGNETNKAINYHQDIKSTGENENNKVIVKRCGKNLFNLDKIIFNTTIEGFSLYRIEKGFKIKSFSNFNSHWSICAQLEMNVRPNTNYFVSITQKMITDAYPGFNPGCGAGYVWIYGKHSSNETILAEFKLNNNTTTARSFMSREFTKVIIKFSSYTDIITSPIGEYDITNIMLEEGTTATAYEPYVEYKQEITLKEPLRSLPNGVCDEIIGNKIIRRIEKFEFKNHPTLDLQYGGESSVTHYCSYFNWNDFKNLGYAKGKGTAILGTNLANVNKTILNNTEGIGSDDGGFNISILRTTLGIPSNYVAGDKLVTYLISKNTTVYYELVTPIIEDILPNYNKESIKTYKLDAPLRSLPNGIKDEIIGNKVIRRCGEVILNGSENWITWGASNSPTHCNCYCYVDNTNNGLSLGVAENSNGIGYNDRLILVSGTYLQSIKAIGLKKQYVSIGLPLTELNLTTSSDDKSCELATKAWLQKNPVKLIYQLATPIEILLTEDTSNVNIQSNNSYKGSLYVGNGTNEVFTTNSIPSNPIIIDTPFKTITDRSVVNDCKYKKHAYGYDMNIVGRGKNLLNPYVYKNIDISIRDIIGLHKDNLYSIPWSNLGRELYIFNIEPNTTYTFSLKEPSSTYQCFIGTFNIYGVGITNNHIWTTLINNQYLTFTTTSEARYVIINGHSNYKVQLEKGNTFSTYESFIPSEKALENITSNDIDNISHKVSLTGFDYSKLLNDNFDKLLRGDL